MGLPPTITFLLSITNILSNGLFNQLKVQIKSSVVELCMNEVFLTGKISEGTYWIGCSQSHSHNNYTNIIQCVTNGQLNQNWHSTIYSGTVERGRQDNINNVVCIL